MVGVYQENLTISGWVTGFLIWNLTLTNMITPPSPFTKSFCSSSCANMVCKFDEISIQFYESPLDMIATSLRVNATKSNFFSIDLGIVTLKLWQLMIHMPEVGNDLRDSKTIETSLVAKLTTPTDLWIVWAKFHIGYLLGRSWASKWLRGAPKM